MPLVMAVLASGGFRSAARTWPIAAVLALVTALVSTARAETALPVRDPARLVYDAASVLGPGGVPALEKRCDELLRKTGVALVVITVPALEDESIGELAVRVGQGWGVGRRGDDRGIVVAFAVADRAIHVATGYGVEEFLNDAKVGRLLHEHALPQLRDGEFAAAILSLVDALSREAARYYGAELTEEVPAPATVKPPLDVGDIVWGLITIVVFLYLLVRHPRLLLALVLTRGRWPSGGGGDRGSRRGGFGGGGFGGGGAGRTF
jgi:uncharacterized protein